MIGNNLDFPTTESCTIFVFWRYISPDCFSHFTRMHVTKEIWKKIIRKCKQTSNILVLNITNCCISTLKKTETPKVESHFLSFFLSFFHSKSTHFHYYPFKMYTLLLGKIKQIYMTFKIFSNMYGRVMQVLFVLNWVKLKIMQILTTVI